VKIYLKFAAVFIGLIAAMAVGGSYGAFYYYTTQHGQGCASCHEMADTVNAVHKSFHRNQNCMDCHEASLATKLRHIRIHLTRKWPEEIRLRDVDVVQMTAKCQKCHQHEYASWHAGPHSATYSEIFANSTHNAQRALMDDCFRCHGMHYNGSVRDLVQPQSTRGPWHITRAGFAGQPTIPCQACHWVHREDAPQTKPPGRISVADAPVHNSLAFFDRRESMHFAASSLALPQLHDGARLVKLSLDPRQGICYQCHAPREPETGTPAAIHAWGPQVGSGDDRTPMGVHEGLSCISCHNGHNENARVSCKTCHPQMSHCGLDVERMDTTFASAGSAHNIHWVKCSDCHQHGIPRMKPPPAIKAQLKPVPGGNG
jgi:hypothetical protein